VLRYGVALVIAALAVLLREALTPLWGHQLPFLTLFPAVYLSAWYGGLGPGLVTTALCAIAATYLWLAPFYSLTTSMLADQVGLALAVLVMLLITWLTAALRRAHETLEHRVQERTDKLTRANFALQAEILERQRAEEALHMPSLVLEHMAEGAAMTDENGTIVFVNPAFTSMFGYANGELRGQSVAILNAYTPEETTRFLYQLGEVLRTQGTWDGEIDNRKKDGTVFTSSCHINSLEVAGKTYWVGVQQDITARKQAEAERTQLLVQIESERARLTTTLEHIPVGVIFSDAVTGKTLLANAQAGEIWHYEARPDFYSPEFARYRGFFSDGRPYQVEDWPIQRALKTGETTTGEEITFIRGDGTRGVMLASAAPIRNPDGLVTAAVVTFADITARKRMEQELRALNVELEQRVQERTAQLQQQNEDLQIAKEELRQQTEELLAARAYMEQERQRYQALFEFAPDGYVVTDTEGVIREANEAAFSLLRVPLNSLQGKPLLAFIAQAGMKEFHSRLTALLQSGGTDEWELSVQPRRGATFTAGLRVASVVDPTGQVEGLRWMLRDITARKQAEAALQESEARFRLLADSAPVLIWVNDLKGCEFVNQEYRRFLGVTETEMHGYDWTPFVHPADREAYVTAYHDAVARRGPFQAQFRFRRNDGTYRWMHSVALPRLDSRGECLGYVGSTTDVTDLKEAEDALAHHVRNLEQANADLRQIAYIFAHDLQEPVRQVGLYTQWLAQRYRDVRDAETTQAMDFIVDGARRMQAQFADLRHYLEVDELGHSVTTTDCEALLCNAVEALREPLAARGATVTHDPLPTLDANAYQLQLVFQELLDNALKFHNDVPPKIRVWTERETGGWRFAVRDNGIGIDPRYQGQLFGLFRQLQRYTAYPGTGMGLAICKKIIDHHGGRIWIESTPGEGATFYFTIPDGSQ
jgi:PAS domain S-box-containing protein